MIDILKNYVKQHFFHSPIKEKESVEAYNIWSVDYDDQPGNLMLDLDDTLFSNLLQGLNLAKKQVADIGCGTGRHWDKLLKHKPKSLTGFDVSAGMLKRLEQKFPKAQTYQITDNLFTDVPDQSYEAIISTLTIAHIKNVEEALQSWCRILKPGGDIIITDFHPSTLAYGGKRTFKHHNKQIVVQNYVHQLADIKEIMLSYNCTLIAQEEVEIDEKVKHYYANQNALHVYESYKGFPIIYGLHFKKKK
ncbi:MAG: methyltransferase protein [Mucilaginibacter sp.]|nr:methyltransferase protein [Mucilaginibacter sp.]